MLLNTFSLLSLSYCTYLLYRRYAIEHIRSTVAKLLNTSALRTVLEGARCTISIESCGVYITCQRVSTKGLKVYVRAQKVSIRGMEGHFTGDSIMRGGKFKTPHDSARAAQRM